MPHAIKSYLTLRRIGQAAIDILVIAGAFALAYVLRFEGDIPARFQTQFFHFLPVVILVRFFFRQALGLHARLWRYLDTQDVVDILIATTLGSLVLWLASNFGYHIKLPWGVLTHDWWLNVAGLIGVRAARQAYVERQHLPTDRKKGTRVLLVGAGQAGHVLAKELIRQAHAIELVGFVDDDRDKLHTRVAGLPVLGTTAEIGEITQRLQVDEIVLCIPSANKGRLLQIVDRCRDAKAKVKLMPGLRDFISGTGALPRMREIQLEDLLRRAPITFDRDAASAYLHAKVVMVTGAGGSVGAELCRQIALLGPKQLLLVGRGEFSIYEVETVLRATFPTLEVVPLMADVRDVAGMTDIFTRYRPTIVFHAAAHKQIPLLEQNPAEAVLNNVYGTRTLAELADRFNVERFVFLSTDKAVRPTSIMGATKRVAELVIQDLAARSATRFISVRFGNVLGTRGSVIPLFKQQIERGGPITVTHPDVIRFFMPLTEATQLMLEAGALGATGETYLLDMGEPLRIVDLAKNVIKLSGFEPEVDIKIAFTGLRPGEKLFEEPLTAEEGTVATRYERLFTMRSEPSDPTSLAAGLDALQTAVNTRQLEVIQAALQAIVPTYQPRTPPSSPPVGEADPMGRPGP